MTRITVEFQMIEFDFETSPGEIYVEFDVWLDKSSGDYELDVASYRFPKSTSDHIASRHPTIPGRNEMMDGFVKCITERYWNQNKDHLISKFTDLQPLYRDQWAGRAPRVL